MSDTFGLLLLRASSQSQRDVFDRRQTVELLDSRGAQLVATATVHAAKQVRTDPDRPSGHSPSAEPGLEQNSYTVQTVTV